MIQRKQSLWLLLAALFAAGVFYFDLYRGEILTGDIVESRMLRVADHYPSLLIALVMVLLPLITIFMFTNRKRQLRMTAIALISTAGFMSMMLWRVTGLTREVPPVTGGNYWVGAVLPVFSLVLLVLAMAGIRSDEKLVRSTDRLR
ncbi:MAG: DUF4293 domain-containing protein [Taibaiella sp.]|nr:DUF4293 domain-containing protein [Taibaiella sp.]